MTLRALFACVGNSARSVMAQGFGERWIQEQCGLVVTMECGDEARPAFAGKPTKDWAIEDPKGKGPSAFRSVRDAIESNVIAALREHDAMAP